MTGMKEEWKRMATDPRMWGDKEETFEALEILGALEFTDLRDEVNLSTKESFILLFSTSIRLEFNQDLP